MKRKREIIFFVTVLLLGVQAMRALDGSASEIRAVETEGTIGFTGVYEPVGTPDPKPPGSSVRPPITEVAKPGGRLPQTNDAGSSHLIWIGILMLSFVFLVGKRKKEQDKTTKNNEKVGTII